MQTFQINTERLEIRNLKSSDLPDFYNYRSNSDVTKYQGFDIFTMQQAKEFIEEQINKKINLNGEWVQLGIASKITQKIVGDCALNLKIENEILLAEIGITISHKKQRMGYAKECLLAIINYLFAIKNVDIILETVDVENIASIELLKTVGFNPVENSYEKVFFKGKWGAEIKFEMQKKDWNKTTLN